MNLELLASSQERADGKFWQIRSESELVVFPDEAYSELGSEREQLLASMLDLMTAPSPPRRNATTPDFGRAATCVCRLPGGREAVLRRSIRGGLPGRFVRTVSFRMPGQRARVEDELATLAVLRRKGVNVPKPLAAAVRFVARLPFAYRSVLATERLLGAENLFVLAKRGLDAKTLEEMCIRVGQEARRMLEAGVFHSDLHLANALSSSASSAEFRITLIDFDRAERFIPSVSEVERRIPELARRFDRFLRKYDVSPAVLGAAFRRGLRSVETKEYGR